MHSACLCMEDVLFACDVACPSRVYPTSPLPLLLSCLLFFSRLCGQALERQKEYFDCIRNERDELRDELADIKGKAKAGEVGPPKSHKKKKNKLRGMSCWPKMSCGRKLTFLAFPSVGSQFNAIKPATVFFFILPFCFSSHFYSTCSCQCFHYLLALQKLIWYHYVNLKFTMTTVQPYQITGGFTSQ